jgi:phenylacetate-CoA ligase
MTQRYFNKATETMSRRDLKRHQFEKLQRLLARIYEKNRFYTAKFKEAGVEPADIHSVDDLAKLPITIKDELIAAQAADPPLGTNATYHKSEYVRFHQTSGTTGVPLRVLDTDESWEWWGRCWGHVFAAAGITPEDRIFFAFSFGPFIGFWSAVEGARRMGSMMIPGGGGDSSQRLHLMQEARPTVLCCTPTYALRLAEVARDENIDLSEIPIRVTLHAGEPGANIPATKARIEAEWTAKCFDHAGASEVGAYTYECDPQPGGIHLIETEFIAEVLDPETGAPVEPGEIGELVITNLGRPCFPAIRYKTGDLVRPNYAQCECERTFMRFDGGILGRADDMIIMRGINIFPRAIENLVRQFDSVDEYRVNVYSEHELGVLEIEVELSLEHGAEEERRAIQRSLTNALSLRPVVKLVESGSLPRFDMKAKRVRVFDDSSKPQSENS